MTNIAKCMLTAVLVALGARPAADALVLAVRIQDGLFPEWESLLARSPLPPGVQVEMASGTGGARDVATLTTSSAAAGGHAAGVVGQRYQAPVVPFWESRESASMTEIRAGALRVLPLDEITLPETAVPVDGLFPGQEGYPLSEDVVLDLQSSDPELLSWLKKAESAHTGPILWLGAVGDIMPARGVDAALLADGGARRVFGDTLPVLRGCDLALGNLESAATLDGTRIRKAFNFRFNPAALAVLKDAGFSYLSITNNHSFDFGQRGFLDTLKNLRVSGIETSGAGSDAQDALRPAQLSARGTRFDVISFGAYPAESTGFSGPSVAAATAARPGILWLDERTIRSAAQQFSPGTFRVAMVHGGQEWRTSPSGEQVRLYRELIDAGVDLVIGSHPHVLQGMEARHGGLIAYSIGNFIFPGMGGMKGGEESVILRVGVFHGKIRYLQEIPARLSGVTVRVDATGRPRREILALSRMLAGR